MFDGNCEEVFNFYKSVLGGEFENLMYFKDGPMKFTEETKDKIMHIEFNFNGTKIMGSDNVQNLESGNNFSLFLNFEDLDDMKEKFHKLSEGGKVIMPVDKTFWGSMFGMFTDKYGTGWMFAAPIPEEN